MRNKLQGKILGGKSMRNKLLALPLVIIMLTSLVIAGCPAPPPPEEVILKVGGFTPSCRFDFAWGTTNFRVMEMLEKEYGAKITFLDVVAFGDYETVMMDFAEAGFDVIIGWCFGALDPANKVAFRFPHIYFVVTCAPHPGSPGFAPNLASMYFTDEEPGYLAGVLAASLTETGKIGFITGTPLPCVSRTLNGFRLGVYHTDPEVEVIWAYIGCWADPATEREIATALIDKGVDIIFALWIGLATADVGYERGIHIIGSQYLMEHRPLTVIADHYLDMDAITRTIFDAILAGEFKNIPFKATMGLGYSYLRWNEALIPLIVSYELRDKVEEVKQAIMRGDIVVPKLIVDMPPQWPHEPVPCYEPFLQPYFPLIGGCGCGPRR